MLWFNLLKKIVMILQSEISPKQVAAGAVLGMLIGFVPAKCLHSYVILIMILMLNVNIGSAFLAAGFAALAGYFADPLAHKIGYLLLVDTSFLTPLWIKLYNTPIVPFTRFYNTVVLGSFVISIILILPVYLFTLKFLAYYRANFKERVGKWKIMKIFNLSSAANLYNKYQ